MASISLTPLLVIAAGALWPPVCTIVVAMRFLARRTQGVQLDVDDWLVLPALVSIAVRSAAVQFSLIRGFSGSGHWDCCRHSRRYVNAEATLLHSILTISRRSRPQIRGLSNPSAEKCGIGFGNKQLSANNHKTSEAARHISISWSNGLQVFWAVELMQVLALSCVKLSCMFFYRRVFRAGGTKIFDAMMFSVVAVIVIWTVSFFFALPFGCRLHFDYLWTSLANEAKCVKSLELQNGFAISDVITDFLVLIFPIPLVSKAASSKQGMADYLQVWKLQMSTARRLGVTSIFLLRAL